jgi:hypothetical protein
MLIYKIGAEDPEINDVRVSDFCFEVPQTAIASIYRNFIQGIIKTYFPGLFTGNQIVKHFTSYENLAAYDSPLENYGCVDSLFNDATILGNLMAKEMFSAKNYCESLQPGSHFITSYYVNTESFKGDRNVYFSTGIFQYWGKGNVIVTDSHYTRNYSMNFEFYMFGKDKYDAEWLEHARSDFFNDVNHISPSGGFSLFGIYKLATINWSSLKRA